MAGFYTVGEISAELHHRYGVEIAPQKISDLVYRRKIPASRCPVVCGVRQIPRDLLPLIESVFAERGILPSALAKK